MGVDSYAYAELLCKTNYSFRVGGSHPQEQVDQAAELGLSALGVVDCHGVYGMPKAYRASKKHPGLKLLIGAELEVEWVGAGVADSGARVNAGNLADSGARVNAADPAAVGALRLAFLARDRASYGVLCRMITAAHAHRLAPERRGESPRLSWGQLTQLMELPGSQGLIAFPIILTARQNPALTTRQGPSLAGRQSLDTWGSFWLSHLKASSLSGRIFLPLVRGLDGRDALRTRLAHEWSRRWDIPIVATNDVHYHRHERRIIQDVLTSIDEGVPLARMGTRLFSNAERFLKSPAEMARLFSDMPEALLRTVQIAESCVFSPSELRYRYPSEWIPPGETAQSYLVRLVWEGARRRYCGHDGVIPADVVRQLEHELKLINELGFADYFLTIWEIVEFARARKILCQGRGSAANSAVCYCLGITAIDPVRMNLLFERFISVERGEPPDIDVDFEHERREEVIQHIYEKYGRDRAAMVAAVVTYRSRLSIREIRKALAGTGYESRPERLQALADELYGFPRHLSIHSGGFTLSADPLIETVPVEPARMDGRTIVQWDKDDLDAIGLLKVDVLSLGMLTALRKALDQVGLGLTEIPPEDPRTYAMIRKADTVGVFQIESRAQMSMLPRLLPRCFYDLVIQIAIVRPGPIVGKMVHPYLRRRRGQEPVDMPHPLLKPILERTLGVPLFQEQVMKMAISLAGFTPGEADELRRAIGAWRSSGEIEKLGRKLMDGLLANGLPEEFVRRVFQQIQGFAEYGFPESHSASFALLAYASSYLKCHYPANFTCALLNSQPMGFYSNHTLVDDAKRHGVSVLPVHPNRSAWDCEITDGGAIRMGWRVVHGMGKAQAAAIVAERTARPFGSLVDFQARTRLRPELLQRLSLGDAFSCFGLDQRHALWESLANELLFRSRERREGGEAEQLSLFSLLAASGAESRQATGTPTFAPLSLYAAIQADYDCYGLSVRGHPMQALRKSIRNLPRETSATLRSVPHGRSVRISGLVIVRQRPPTASGVTFATLEDEHGFSDLIFHREVFEKYRELFVTHAFLIAQGVIQRDGNSVSLLVRRLKAVWQDESGEPSEKENLRAKSHDFH